MRIVNLISGKDLGGPKQAFVHYSDNLRHLGHQVTSIIRPSAQIQPLLHAKDLPFRHLDYPRSRLPGLRQLAQRRLGQLLQEYRPEVVIVHKPIDAELISAVLPHACTLVLVLHSYTAKGLHTAHMILPVSPSVDQFVRSQSYKGPTLIMPNLVEMGTVEPATPQPRQPLHIASMGVMRRTKGQDLLITALASLRNRQIDFVANIAGKGRWINKISKLIDSYKLYDCVKLSGWVSNDQRQAFFDNADVICVPSRQETFGMVVTEAMAQKKLVVATRCGGPESIITDAKNGLLADINAESIASKLEQAHGFSAEEFRCLCENAYHHVLENYSQAPFRKRLEQMVAKATTLTP